MAIKVYQKRGNLNYKERKLITEIEQSLFKKFGEDTASLKFNPATNFEQLKELHGTYCGEEVAFEEIPNTEQNNEQENHKKFRDTMKTEDKADDFFENIDDESDKNFIDPLNREEPLVRDYVMNEESASTQGSGSKGNSKLSFDEPLSFEDSFEIPGENTADRDKRNNATPNNSSNTAKPTNNQGGMGQQRTNNSSGQPDDAKKKKRSSQRFAKYIVSTVCMLAEKGFVWYANNDINESKLAQYELSEEIDLSILVTLENGQEATIKQFFQSQCFKAEELSKISKEEQEDLTDAVAELLIEKDIHPTPTQEVLLIGLKILGGKFISAFALKSQTNDLLNQLRSMKTEDSDAGEYAENVYREPEVVKEEVKEAVKETTEDDDEKYLIGRETQTIE